ncbi:GIY-YIG nuclease family protein [Gemmatimonadota bacterium]
MTIVAPRRSPMPSPNAGFIYVLSNNSMPGLIKVGCTSRHPDHRAIELSSSSGVASPFIVDFSAEVSNAVAAESAAHEVLGDKRLSKDREFFRCSISDAIDAIAQAISSYVIVRPVERERCITCGALLHAEAISWDSVSGPYWSCYNCDDDVLGIRAVSEHFNDIRADLERIRTDLDVREHEIEKQREKLNVGRCPDCSCPIFQVDKITVIGAGGEASFITYCPKCASSLRAVGNTDKNITFLDWERM